jgi:ankyrin repeat protein
MAPEDPAPEDPARERDAPDERLVELAHQMFDLARAGDRERLAAYVEAGVPADLTDASGNTLLMLAAYHGNAATVEDLARLGADVDRVNDRGQSPLAGAVFKGEPEVVSVLPEARADPDAGSPSARETGRMFGQEGMLSTDPSGAGADTNHGGTAPSTGPE